MEKFDPGSMDANQRHDALRANEQRCQTLTEELAQARRKIQQLRESEELLHSLFDAIGESAALFRSDGTVLAANCTFAQRMGRPLADCIGQNIYHLIPPELAEARRVRVQQVIDERRPVFFEDERDGRFIFHRLFPVLNAHGEVDRLVVYATDITDRKLDEQRMRESQAQLLEAQALAHIGSWQLDLRTGRLTWSDEIYRIFGLKPQEFEATYEAFLIAIHPEDRDMVNRAYTESVRTRKPYAIIHRLLAKDGSVKYVQEQGRTFYDDQGQALRSVGTVQDITELRSAQARLDHYQRTEMIGRLAGGVAHDFNNHLQAILGFVELILEGMDPARKEYADLVEIQKAARYSAELTKQLLIFSRKQLVQPKVLNLNHVLTDMLKMIQRLVGEGIEIMWRPSVQLDPILMDATQVNQILMNLCVNARDAMKGSGVITIETDNVTCDEAFCANRPDRKPGHYVRLQIRDTGCGMEPRVMEHLFEPFYTTKAFGQGSGLGLPTVHGIVLQNQGFIDVQSEPGQGTTFILYLPRCPAEALPQPVAGESKPEPGDAQGQGKTLIILDDEGAIMRFGMRALTRHGYRVLPARNAAEAMSLARNHPEHIDLLLTDVVMPDMSGRELARQVALLRPDIKCLFMSGYSHEELIRDGVVPLNVHVLAKPFSGETLTTQVRQALER